MKVGEQLAMVLLCLISGIYAAWRERVCEGKYNGNSCLGSYPCMEAFLRCDCIPLQFAGQKFEELCWTSLAYEVGAPTCCIDVEKRKHTLSKRKLSDTKNVVRGIPTSVTRYRRNYGYRKNVELNLDLKYKIKQNEKRTNTMNDLSIKQNTLTSKLDRNDLGSVYTKYVHDPVNVKLADKFRNNSRQNLVIDIIAAFVQSWKALNEPKHGNTNNNPSHISVCNDLDINDKITKLNDDASADENQSDEALTVNSKHFNIISSQYDNENNKDSSAVAGSENVIPRLLQVPSEKDEGGANLKSLSNMRTVQTRANVDLMQSKILKALNHL